MCEFCAEHGEGKIWYLAMKNYGQELLSQGHRREHIAAFFKDFETSVAGSLAALDAIQALPFVPDVVSKVATARQKKWHFGQVVPIEDVDLILDSAAAVRMPQPHHRSTRSAILLRLRRRSGRRHRPVPRLRQPPRNPLARRRARGDSSIGQRRASPFGVDIRYAVHRRLMQLRSGLHGVSDAGRRRDDAGLLRGGVHRGSGLGSLHGLQVVPRAMSLRCDSLHGHAR